MRREYVLNFAERLQDASAAHLATSDELKDAVTGNNDESVVLRHVKHQLLRLGKNAYALRHRIAQAPAAHGARRESVPRLLIMCKGPLCYSRDA